jgi:predicted kinase
MTVLAVPALSLVVLVGVSGSGKSTFAARAFGPHEVLSSDFCRALVSGDENDQSASADAFDVLHHIAGKRLDRGLLTVVDATSVTSAARQSLVQLARDHDVLPVAIVLDVGVEVAIERNRLRPDRDFGDGPIRRQASQLRRGLRSLAKEGFRGSGCSATSPTRPARSTSSATSTAAWTSCSPCWTGSATARSRTGRAARSTPSTPTGDGWSSSATSSTAALPRSGCCAWRWA